MSSPAYEKMTIEELLNLVETLAKESNDGHLTMMRFTSGWKIFLGTPDLDSGDGREQIGKQVSYKEIRDGMISLLKNPQNSIY